MKKFTCCGLLLLATIGCNKPSSEEAASSASAQPTSSQSNVAQASGSGAQPVVLSGAGTEPGEIVALFLDSLRRGDENAANSVLTLQAQTELAKTDYALQPLGTPEGKYKIGRVGYVDGDTNTGLVECLWTEPSPVTGQPPIEMEIVCEVHKEPQGWRIGGLAVKMTGTEETFVLDFEDAKSLQEAFEGTSGQPDATASAQTVATQSNLPQLGEPQLPGGVALPGQTQPQGNPQFAAPTQALPAQLPQAPQADFNQQQPTQIALPPSGNVNRY